ncbi:hypothetical protein FAI40_04720 [Acetobacteraceae bacterium]|nr:hypothetical protein FAI40_04720 [Acetobacteraceae bacterium]
MIAFKEILTKLSDFIPQGLNYIAEQDEILANDDRIAHRLKIPTIEFFLMNKAVENAGGKKDKILKSYQKLTHMNNGDPKNEKIFKDFKELTGVDIRQNGNLRPDFLQELSESSQFEELKAYPKKRNKVLSILGAKFGDGLDNLLETKGDFNKAIEANRTYAPTEEEITNAKNTDEMISESKARTNQFIRKGETAMLHGGNTSGTTFTSMYNPEAVMNLQEGISDGSLSDGTNPEKIRKIKAVINTIGNTIGDSFTSPYNTAESVKNQVARLNEEKSTSQSPLSKHFGNKAQSLIGDNSELGTLIEQEASQSSRLAPVDALNSPDSSVSSVVENASDFHPENFAPETDSSSTDRSIGTLPIRENERPRVSKRSQISVVRQNVSKAPSVNPANNAVKNLRQKIVQQKNALSAKGQKFPNKTSPNVRQEGNAQALAKSIEKSDKVQKETISAQQIQRDSIHNATSNNTANCTYQTEIRTGDIIVNDAHTEDPFKFGDQVEKVITEALNRTSRIFNPNIAI